MNKIDLSKIDLTKVDLPKITLNHAVAVLGLILAASVFLAMTKYGVPQKISFGAAILSILVVSIFWTSVSLTDAEDDDY